MRILEDFVRAPFCQQVTRCTKLAFTLPHWLDIAFGFLPVVERVELQVVEKIDPTSDVNKRFSRCALPSSHAQLSSSCVATHEREFDGKRNKIGLGKVPTLTLMDRREQR